MIVPEYWAEARIQKRFPDRQITVRRFGWSDESQEAAQQHADQRVAEAFQRIVDGDPLPRREQRRGYNGSEGTPIREEIVQRHGDTIITRNAYGALCLNTPNVLFADIDVEAPGISSSGCATVVAIVVIVAWRAWTMWGVGAAAIAAFVALIVSTTLAFWLANLWSKLSGGPRAVALKQIERVMHAYSNWRARLYSTPAGFRLLVTHQTFDPTSSEVGEFFTALGVDRVYAAMCQRQGCFRARISPKPWRINMERHIVPRRGGWPVADELLPERQRWVEDYDKLAIDFASCRFETEYGTMPECSEAAAVVRIHDDFCRATRTLPLA